MRRVVQIRQRVHGGGDTALPHDQDAGQQVGQRAKVVVRSGGGGGGGQRRQGQQGEAAHDWRLRDGKEGGGKGAAAPALVFY